MNSIDNMLGNMLNKRKKEINTANNIMVNKPNTPYKPTQIINNLMPIRRTSAGPAPVRQQNMWARMPIQNKIVSRMTMRDADRDGYPDNYDCQPNNPNRDRIIVLNESIQQHVYKQAKKGSDKNVGQWFNFDSYESFENAADEQQSIDDEHIHKITTGPYKGKYMQTHITKIVKNKEVPGEYQILIKKLVKPRIF